MPADRGRAVVVVWQAGRFGRPSRREPTRLNREERQPLANSSLEKLKLSKTLDPHSFIGPHPQGGGPLGVP